MPWTNQAVTLIVLEEEATGFSGLFGYSPAPGTGNLIFSIAAAAGTDPYGNTYPAGLNVGQQASAHADVDPTGNARVYGTDGVLRILTTNGTAPGLPADPAMYFYNDFGAVVLVVDPQSGGLFQYLDNGDATQGTLIGWQSSKNSTDPVLGQAVQAGVQLIDPVFGDFIRLAGAIMRIGIGVAFSNPVIIGPGQGSGAQGPVLKLCSPSQTTTGQMTVWLFGESPDGTVPAGQVIAPGNTSSAITRDTSALLEVQGSGNFSGDLTCQATLEAGAATLASLTVTGNETLDGTLTAVGAIVAEASVAAQEPGGPAGTAETWHTITTGFPAGWSGRIDYRLLAEAGGLVMLNWAIKIASGTVVTSGEVLATLPSGYFFPTDNKFVPANIGSGAGLAANDGGCFARISSGGAFEYQGPAGTLTSQAFFYGQGIITTAV